MSVNLFCDADAEEVGDKKEDGPGRSYNRKASDAACDLGSRFFDFAFVATARDPFYTTIDKIEECGEGRDEEDTVE